MSIGERFRSAGERVSSASERVSSAIDSLGTKVLWLPVVVAAAVALCGAFLEINLMNGQIVFETRPIIKNQVPWLFVVLLTVAVALGSKSLMNASETMWRSWLFRIGLPIVLLAVTIFYVAEAQATAFEYLIFRSDGALLRPAFPYARAFVVALALVGQFAMLVSLRRRGSAG